MAWQKESWLAVGHRIIHDNIGLIFNIKIPVVIMEKIASSSTAEDFVLKRWRSTLKQHDIILGPYCSALLMSF